LSRWTAPIRLLALLALASIPLWGTSFYVLHVLITTAIFIIAAIGCLGAGLALAGYCDGGDSLVLFGGATALVGALLFRSGAWATVIPVAIVTLTLVAGGWYGATVAGCHV